jgi:hypothetical protein
MPLMLARFIAHIQGLGTEGELQFGFKDGLNGP